LRDPGRVTLKAHSHQACVSAGLDGVCIMGQSYKHVTTKGGSCTVGSGVCSSRNAD